jgi:hypothetical protein
VFSVVRARTVATLTRARLRHQTIEAMQAGVLFRSEPRHVFSVMLGSCRVYTNETNSEARSCESQDNGNTKAYNGVQQSAREIKMGAST